MEKVKLDRVPDRPAAKVRQVPVSVRADHAAEVSITGDFTGWSEDGISLRKSRTGQFRVILELPPGQYQYRLKIDGQWADDLEAAQRVPNPFGSENCVLDVS